MKSKPMKDSDFIAARNKITSIKCDLLKLNQEHEDTLLQRKGLIDNLQNKLGVCRNGDERQSIHQRIEFEKKETVAINRIFKQSIHKLECELSDANHELRVLINSTYEYEYEKFKNLLPDIDAVRLAYAAHSMSFAGGTWRDFLESLWPEPVAHELDNYLDAIKEYIYAEV